MIPLYKYIKYLESDARYVELKKILLKRYEPQLLILYPELNELRVTAMQAQNSTVFQSYAPAQTNLNQPNGHNLNFNQNNYQTSQNSGFNNRETLPNINSYVQIRNPEFLDNARNPNELQNANFGNSSSNINHDYSNLNEKMNPVKNDNFEIPDYPYSNPSLPQNKPVIPYGVYPEAQQNNKKSPPSGYI